MTVEKNIFSNDLFLIPVFLWHRSDFQPLFQQFRTCFQIYKEMLYYISSTSIEGVARNCCKSLRCRNQWIRREIHHDWPKISLLSFLPNIYFPSPIFGRWILTSVKKYRKLLRPTEHWKERREAATVRLVRLKLGWWRTS